MLVGQATPFGQVDPLAVPDCRARKQQITSDTKPGTTCSLFIQPPFFWISGTPLPVSVILARRRESPIHGISIGIELIDGNKGLGKKLIEKRRGVKKKIKK